MSGATTAAAITGITALAAAGIGAGTTVYMGNKQQQAQKKAMSQQKAAQANAEAQAKSQQMKSETEMNKANQKQPDMASIMKAAQATGGSGTMLTGPGGVDQGSLTLGKSTLLGA